MFTVGGSGAGMPADIAYCTLHEHTATTRRFLQFCSFAWAWAVRVSNSKLALVRRWRQIILFSPQTVRLLDVAVVQ